MRLPWQRDKKAEQLQRRADAAFARVVETVATQTAQDLADEDASWRKIAAGNGSEDLNQQQREDACAKCLSVWQRDPGLARAADLLCAGTFGQGIAAPKAVDSRVQAVVDRFWEDEDNQLYLCGREARSVANVHLMVYGEVFYTVHVNPATSEVKVGRLPASEITEVITHPESDRRPVLYQRKLRPLEFDFTTGSYRSAVSLQTWYYRDVGYMDDAKLAEDDAAAAMIGAAPNLQEQVYVYHLKTNTIGKRGVPEFLRAYDWVKAHHRALSDLATWTKAAAMFAWQMKMKTKSQAALTNAAKQFREPVPGTGAVAVHNEGVDLSAIDQPSGSGNLATAVRAMHLESIRAFPFGEHFYADASTGNLATSQAMELPAIWGISYRQELFREVYLALLGIAIERAVQMQDYPNRRIPQSVDRYVDVDFPPAKPEQVAERAQAIVALAPFIDEQEAAAQAYNALGSNDVAQLMERQFPKETKLDGETAEVDGADVEPTAALSEPELVREAVVTAPFQIGGQGNG